MTETRALSFVTMVGSLRKASLNAMIARTLPALAPEGVTIAELPPYRDFPIYDADIQAEGFPAPVTAMAEAIRAADGVIVVTPEYNYSVPGGLKNAIDWISRLPNQPFAGKPILIQTASQGPLGGARSQYHLRQIMVFLEAHVFNRPEVMVGAAQTKVDAAAGVLTEQATRDFIAGQLKAFAAYVRRFA